MNIVKKYWENLYQCLILYIPLACMCAGVYYTLSWKCGGYQNINTRWLWIFDATQVIYLLISLFFIYEIRVREKSVLQLLPQMKLHISLSLAIQFNFIIHLFACDYVWTCIFIFFVLIVFFADYFMMLANSLFYIVSLFIGQYFHSEEYLPLDTPDYGIVLVFRIVVVCVVAIFLWLLSYLFENFLKHTQREEEENQFLLEKQLAYYQHLDIMDKQTRRFRHDIKNHFLCMQGLLEKEDFEGATAYLKALTEAGQGQQQMYLSGNVIVDSIMNYHIFELQQEKEIVIAVYGKLTTIHTVTSMELCTVFSNMLTNAISAIRSGTVEDPELTLHFQHGENYFSITVSNSTSKWKVDMPNTRHKRNDRNHGHGIYQIEAVVKKYQGTFEQKIEDGRFISKVCLPI